MTIKIVTELLGKIEELNDVPIISYCMKDQFGPI